MRVKLLIKMEKTMSDVKRLVRIDFDNMENRNPVTKKVLGVFVGDERGLTAHGKASEWFKKQEPVHFYLGYDGQIYPQFRLEHERAL